MTFISLCRCTLLKVFAHITTEKKDVICGIINKLLDSSKTLDVRKNR